MSDRAEKFVTFDSGENRLCGILHGAHSECGAVMIMLVGGAQYRVGSHRMYVKLARRLSPGGPPVLRFDFSGMGDSDGQFEGFTELDGDIGAACDAALRLVDGARRIVLFGLCDGASAAAMYASRDSRVAGVVLLNPWVHTETGEAKAFVWHYYPKRLLQKDFWVKLIRGGVRVGASAADFFTKMRKSFTAASQLRSDSVNFIASMRTGLANFRGESLIILSENDLTAAEFDELLKADKAWSALKARATVKRLGNADHTLSSITALDEASEIIKGFLNSLSVRGHESRKPAAESLKCH